MDPLVKTSMLEYYDVHANAYDRVYSGEFPGSAIVGSDAYVEDTAALESSSGEPVPATSWMFRAAPRFGCLPTLRTSVAPC